jgi:hypothetical protein
MVRVVRSLLLLVVVVVVDVPEALGAREVGAR